MSRACVRWPIVAASLAACAAAASAAPTFTSPPTATRAGDAVRIEFAVGEPTDVAVEILDGQGQTVRHLAAGVLGENAPEPLQKNSLAQKLSWDGRDDVGKPVAAAACRVRVGLGLAPELAKLENFDPLNFGAVLGIAPLPGGGAAVFGCGGYPDYLPRVVAVSRAGEYERQLYPPPADAKPADSPGLKGFRRGDGKWVPMFGGTMPRAKGSPFYSPMAAGGGRVFFCPFSAGPIWAVDAETAAVAGPLGADALGQGQGRIAVRAMAVSPDGTLVYLAGVECGRDGETPRPLHAVFRMPADGSDGPKPFAGEPDKSGNTESLLDTPVGLATDAAGNLFVCDNGNGRVAVFTPAGKLLRTMQADASLLVATRPGGGVHVFCGGPAAGARVLKAVKARVLSFSADGRPAGTLDIAVPPKMKGAYVTGLAADGGDGQMLWLSLAGEAYPATAGALLRSKLAETTLEPLPPVSTDFRHFQTKGPYDPRYMYNWGGSYNGYGEAFDWSYFTDEGTLFYSPGPLSREGLWADGRRYRWNKSWNWWKLTQEQIAWQRFNADGSPAPFAATGTNELPLAYKPRAPWFAQRGTFVDRRGHVYMRYSYDYPQAREEKLDPRNEWHTGIVGYDQDGNKLGEVHLTHGTYGFGVDVRGNLYVADKPRPAGALVPEDVEKAFDGKVPASIANWYGSVIRFGPAGGRFVFAKGSPAAAGAAVRTRGDLFSPVPAVLDADRQQTSGGIPSYKATLTGADWMWVGVSPMVSTAACICYGTSLAVDPHGRVFAPDKMACRVAVLDANGNLIRYIGSYGNMDSRGAGSPVPEPQIAFAAVRMVTAATSRQVRVADNGNGWVSVIRLGYEKETSVPVGN